MNPKMVIEWYYWWKKISNKRWMDWAAWLGQNDQLYKKWFLRWYNHEVCESYLPCSRVACHSLNLYWRIRSSQWYISSLSTNGSNPTSVHDKLGSGDTCRCMYLASKRLFEHPPSWGEWLWLSCWIMAWKFIQWFPENPTWRFQTRRTYKLQTSPSHNLGIT